MFRAVVRRRPCFNVATRTYKSLPKSNPAYPGFLASLEFQRSTLNFSETRRLADVLYRIIPPGFKKFFPEKEKERQEAAEKAKMEKEQKQSEDGGEENGGGNNQSWMTYLIIGMGLILATNFFSSDGSGSGKSLSFQEFSRKYLANKMIRRVVVMNKNQAVAELKPSDSDGFGDSTLSEFPHSVRFKIGSVESFERNMENAQLDYKIHPRDFVPISYQDSIDWGNEVLKWSSVIVPLGILFYLFRGGLGGMSGGAGKNGGIGNIFSIGKANIHDASKNKIKVAFKDVAGLDEAKVEVMEFVDFLKNPGKYTKLGARIPKGALLVGPPGTGKTLLAKATAGEASVPFFSISGSDFIEMFVGVGPSRVRDLFAKARKNAPCIIFIDEIDAVGRKRGNNKFGGGNDERENTLNQLLVEMDGFKSHEGVVVLAGTNRSDILDQALLRPGRFDRQILIDKPDIKGRKQIFMVHLKPLKVNHSLEDLADRMSALTPGFAGADIANICNEAAIIAARQDKEHIDLRDFEAAVDRVIGGLEKKSSVMSPKEKRIVAYHEAGHAVAGWFLEHANPLLKVTIVPRGSGALGFAQYLPQEISLYNSLQLEDMMCVSLGGRASEKVFFDIVSTGASDDLKKVTNIAYGQILTYGMSSRIGNLSFDQGEEGGFYKPYSEKTGDIIDEEAKLLVDNAYKRVIGLLEEKREFVKKLAEKLLEQETVNHDDLVEVLGARPFQSPEYANFLNRKDDPIETIDATEPEEKPSEETPEVSKT